MSTGIRAAIVLCLLTVAACGSTATTTAPTTPSPTRTPPALSDKLLIAVPTGYTQQPETGANHNPNVGPFDLSRAALFDGGADAQTVLTKDHFVGAYVRAWNDASNKTSVLVFLYQFSDASGANDYGQRLRAVATSQGAAASLAPIPVPNIPGAIGFGSQAPGQMILTTLFVTGPYLAEVGMVGPAATNAETVALAEAQYARLHT